MNHTKWMQDHCMICWEYLLVYRRISICAKRILIRVLSDECQGVSFHRPLGDMFKSLLWKQVSDQHSALKSDNAKIVCTPWCHQTMKKHVYIYRNDSETPFLMGVKGSPLQHVDLTLISLKYRLRLRITGLFSVATTGDVDFHAFDWHQVFNFNPFDATNVC